jgi:hypothetical protein
MVFSGQSKLVARESTRQNPRSERGLFYLFSAAPVSHDQDPELTLEALIALQNRRYDFAMDQAD